jgi:hypothetical protein
VRRRGLVLAALVAAACGPGGAERGRIAPMYDQQSGRLKELRYDANGDGTVDTVSFMDGARVLRVEIDKDQDGKVERWEHYGDDQQLVKVGFSRANDGHENAWSYAGPDGAISRVEIAGTGDPKLITRIERYERDVLTRAEEDTNADGRIDKWETYENGRLAAVVFDSTHRGSADRRLTYRSDGTVLVEEDPDGDGRFEPAAQP